MRQVITLSYNIFKLNIPQGYRTFLFWILNCCAASASAQLDRLPKVEASVQNPEQVARLEPLIFTTFSRTLLTAVEDGSESFQDCIQIIDPVRPWPPIWYLSADSSLFNNAQVYPGGLMSFTREELSRKKDGASARSSDFRVYITKNFSIIDTIDQNKLHKPIDGHEFQVSGQGEKLFFSFIDTTLNVSELTKNAVDTAVLCRVSRIVLLNDRDQIIFFWNPLQHIPLNERHAIYKGIGGNKHVPTEYDWNHANSLTWADDGNILYSFRNIGVGKINLKNGDLIWQLGTASNGIFLEDSDLFFGQHDFKQIKSGPYKGMYSMLSNGNDEHQYLTANIYNIDEAKMSATLLHKLVIDSTWQSHGLGSYNWANNMQIICYGFYEPPPFQSNTRLAFASIADSSDKVIVKYYLPAHVYAYRLEAYSDWSPILPQRPVIKPGKEYLYVDSNTAGSFTWYELVGKEMNCVTKGEGSKFYPSKAGTYIVTKHLSLGTIVSEPFHYQN